MVMTLKVIELNVATNNFLNIKFNNKKRENEIRTGSTEKIKLYNYKKWKMENKFSLVYIFCFLERNAF